MLNNYNHIIDFYNQEIKGTGYLAFRDLHTILNASEGDQILDFGCGAGRSSRYLKKLGFEVTAVDINETMIKTANNNVMNCNFYHMRNGEIPFPSKTFDVVFNSFVLFDMSTREEIIANFKEMKRVCKQNGKVISIVNSDYLFQKKWLTVKNNFPQNRNLKSGDVARIFLSDIKITLYDYYWTNKDYKECFKIAGFTDIEIYESLGKLNDGYLWRDEVIFPPYSIYICK